MIGSNYIYPKETNREVKALLEKHGGENVGEEYAPLGHTEFSTIINNIAGSGAGSGVLRPGGRFDRRLLQAVPAVRHRRAEDLPICTPITTEQEIAAMGAGKRRRPLHVVQLLPDGRHAREQGVRRALQGEVRREPGDQRGDGGGLLPDLFPRAGNREGRQSTDTDALIFEGLARPGVQGAAGAGQDRREEPPHLAVGAHRQGPRRWPVRHRLDLGGPHPPRPVGRPALSEQGLRLHQSARCSSG